MPHYNGLFLCTGNSARSIMAEAILNFKGRPNFTGYSAGSHPSGRVRPEALRQLATAHVPEDGLRSKSWEEFSLPDAPKLDFVFTVCDNAAREVCPVWPGQPITGHWGVPDPAAVVGSEGEVQSAYREAFFMLYRRISLFCASICQSQPADAQTEGRRYRRAVRAARFYCEVRYECDSASEFS